MYWERETDGESQVQHSLIGAIRDSRRSLGGFEQCVAFTRVRIQSATSNSIPTPQTSLRSNVRRFMWVAGKPHRRRDLQSAINSRSIALSRDVICMRARVTDRGNFFVHFKWISASGKQRLLVLHLYASFSSKFSPFSLEFNELCSVTWYAY